LIVKNKEGRKTEIFVVNWKISKATQELDLKGCFPVAGQAVNHYHER